MFHSSEIVATINPDAVKAIAIVIAVFMVMAWGDLRGRRND